MLVGTLRHVKWFIDPRPHPTHYELLLTAPVLAAFAIALVAVGIAYLIQHHVPEPRAIRSLERFARTGPLALRIALGVSLIAAAIAGWLFVPSLAVDPDAGGYAVLAVEVLCGGLILAGWLTRYAALLLAALGVVAMVPFSLEGILEQVHILGIAVFLFLSGPGAVSLDARRGVVSLLSTTRMVARAPFLAIRPMNSASGRARRSEAGCCKPVERRLRSPGAEGAAGT